MSADPKRLDMAVRAFKRQNPMRWPCACIGCVITIKANYHHITLLEQERERAERS